MRIREPCPDRGSCRSVLAERQSCTGRSLATQDLMDQRYSKFCLLAHKQDIYPKTHINESMCAFAHLHEPRQLLFDFLYSPVVG